MHTVLFWKLGSRDAGNDENTDKTQCSRASHFCKWIGLSGGDRGRDISISTTNTSDPLQMGKIRKERKFGWIGVNPIYVKPDTSSTSYTVNPLA